MIILYILLIAYILAINFYAFLLVKSLKDDETKAEQQRQAEPLSSANNTETSRSAQRSTGKLCITGILGGAITIYICMFILKYRRSDLFLMVLMPLFGVLNIYLWVLLFRSGLSFFIIR